MAVKAPLSVLILTHNEEENLRHCLESVAGWAAEIVVVDSHSSDRTVEIARRFTDKVFFHDFENHGKQVNWALQEISFTQPWILQLDADEMVTPELAGELSEKLEELPAGTTGLYAKRRVYFLGRWIRHGDYYPIWLLRVFRLGAARNEEFEEDRVILLRGRAEFLAHDFIDFNRKGIAFWVQKHNGWAQNEARDMLRLASSGASDHSQTLAPRLFSGQDQRRRWLKLHVYSRLPLFLRAFLYFLYRYLFRFGFLDGREGLIFHFLQAFWYRFLVDARIFEARLAPPDAALGIAFAEPKND